jgi:phage tail-like protein
MSLLTMVTEMLGRRPDPYVAFNFLVEIDSLLVGGFSEVSGLQVETELHDYREGGLNEYVHKLAGPTRYPQNLVLKHGITYVDTLWAWHQEVVHGRCRRHNLTIYLLNAARSAAIWWNVREAYPCRWSGPDLRADQAAVAFESIELVHRGFSRHL